MRAVGIRKSSRVMPASPVSQPVGHLHRLELLLHRCPLLGGGRQLALELRRLLGQALVGPLQGRVLW
jgi:hypothetical protein